LAEDNMSEATDTAPVGRDYRPFLAPDHPLLERFRLQAGASCRHCENVANICDAVAAELGEEVDRDLLKVAARFHDVGKIMAASYFGENQNGQGNPHNDLTPYASALVIMKHIPDSVTLLHRERFPAEVIDAVLEHHGTTLVKHFYIVAKEASEDGKVSEDLFRYPWSPPTTAEAAVLLISDVVEAKARSLYDDHKLDDVVGGRRGLVQGVIADLDAQNQFDRIRHGLLRVIQRVVTRELETLFHSRPAYAEEGENPPAEKVER
jgi:cyclic-di-AMP phosphodiesterase PgpH